LNPTPNEIESFMVAGETGFQLPLASKSCTSGLRMLMVSALFATPVSVPDGTFRSMGNMPLPPKSGGVTVWARLAVTDAPSLFVRSDALKENRLTCSPLAMAAFSLPCRSTFCVLSKETMVPNWFSGAPSLWQAHRTWPARSPSLPAPGVAFPAASRCDLFRIARASYGERAHTA
jgi:hypothetical protein